LLALVQDDPVYFLPQKVELYFFGLTFKHIFSSEHLKKNKNKQSLFLNQVTDIMNDLEVLTFCL